MLEPEIDTFDGKIQTAIRNAQNAIRDAHQTWMLQPHLVDQVKAIVDQHLLGGLIEVQGSFAVPENTVIIVKTEAMKQAIDFKGFGPIRLR